MGLGTANGPNCGLNGGYSLKAVTMTANLWEQLRKKAESAPETPPETELPSPAVQIPPVNFDENPFAGGDDEATAISAAQDLITTDREKIKAVSNLRDPVAYAIAHMQIEWEKQEGADALAAVDESLISNLEILENSRQGKDNRAKLFADAIKAINMQEFEMEKSTGNKLMGKS